LKSVWVVFKVYGDELELFNIQSTEEKAIAWIDKFGKNRKFIYEEYQVH